MEKCYFFVIAEGQQNSEMQDDNEIVNNEGMILNHLNFILYAGHVEIMAYYIGIEEEYMLPQT